MQTSGPEFWWAVGIGSVSLVVIAAAYIFSIVFNQRRFISEQQRQLEAIRESERKYRNLFENSQVGIVRVSTEDLRIVDCNATFLRIFEKTTTAEVEDLLQQTISKEDRHFFLQSLRQEKAIENVERRLLVNGGSSVWISLSFRTFPDREFAEGILVDITERKNAEEQLLASHRQLRNLSAHLQSVREEERVKIAREIHDELGQVLTVAKMYLSVLLDGIMAGQPTSMESIHKNLESITKIVDDSITLVKNIAYQLRPIILDDLGLREAVEWEVGQFEKKTGIRCVFESNDHQLQLGREESAAVFRIVQEALTNIVRHAKASNVVVAMHADEKNMTVEITDNGRGIQARDIQNPKSLGIIGMKERALFLGGQLEVASARNGGTTVALAMPVNGRKNGTT